MKTADNWTSEALANFQCETEMVWRRAVLKRPEENPMTLEEGLEHLRRSFLHVASDDFKEFTEHHRWPKADAQ